MRQIFKAAYGKWPSILATLGVPEAALTNTHGPCPLCGGTDRFRFDNKEGRGTYYCNQCGAGDGMTLAMKFKGISFVEAARSIGSILGEDPQKLAVQVAAKMEPLRPVDHIDTGRWISLWRAASPVAQSPIARRYFEGRGIELDGVEDLRFFQNVFDGEGGAHPAILALVHDAAGKPVQMHRTFLMDDGSAKAQITQPRKLMRGAIPHGSAVRLLQPGRVLGIAEGIETALSASALWDVPVWAALSATFLSHWKPPAGIEELLIFADHDMNSAGLTAALKLKDRLRDAPVHVEIVLPDRPGSDWNDELRRVTRKSHPNPTKIKD